MGKPVICPHCNEFFVSDNEPGNPFCLCAKCGRWMNIAPPARRKKRKPARPTQCPFCKAPMSPGSDTCLKCQRQIITGEKLPILRRLALVPTTTKMIALCGGLAALVAMIFIGKLIANRGGQPEPQPPVQAVDSPEVITARQTMAKLLSATDEAEQARLGEALGKIGPAAVGAIVDTLGRRELSEGARHALITALGEIGDPRGADGVVEALDDPPLRLSAMISLALMGDRRAAAPLTQHFAEHVRRVSMGQVLIKRSLIVPRVDRAVVQREWGERLAHLRRALSALGEPALPRLLQTYGSAWRWPTRDRGRAWLDQVDRVLSAMTISGKTPDEALEGLLVNQSPEVRLGAAMLLSKRRGDRRLSERWAGMIGDLLADSRLEVRQRAVWTVASITNKVFGRFGADRPPIRAPAAALTEASAWIQQRTGRKIEIAASLLAEHASDSAVVRRTYHPARAKARRLIDGLPQADWSTARKRQRELAKLPPDAAPVVRALLEGDVRQLRIPARWVLLQLAAHWRDRASVRPMGRLEGLLDNPAWMPACLAVARASARGDRDPKRWLEVVAGVDEKALAGTDPNRGFVPDDLGPLIAAQGRPALTAMHRDSRYHIPNGPLIRAYHATIKAMIDYGWPVPGWLKELGPS